MKPELIDSFDPIGEADIAQFERELDIKLPKDYRDFLLKTNGAYFKDAVRNEEYSSVESLYGLVPEALRGYVADLRSNPFFDEAKTLLRIGHTGLGDELLLRIKGADFWTVWMHYVDFDSDDDETTIRPEGLSFTEFLDSLVLDPDRHMSEESDPLFRAIEDGDQIYFFNEFRPRDIDKHSDRGWPMLSVAAARGRLRIMKHLLTHEVDIEEKGPIDETPAFRAVRGHSVDALKLLIEHGANVNAINAERESLLMLAVGIDNMRGALHLLESGADANYRSPEGKSTLDVCRFGSYAYDFVRPVLKARMRLS